MIEVKHLTKKYGSHLAVDDLNFSIENGKIYGFLGPNGAGKSTTMNMMTGYLGMTSGQVIIDGHDILEEPQEAKASIGYLPEQPPLYMDMTVREYMKFAAELKKIPGKERKEAIRAAMEKTGIEEIEERLIKNVSKGYKQRVGIAQAILGMPPIIILDEPTVGLDPKQVMEIRELIRELGKEHTVILSSHILQEIRAVCDHILIISHGRLVASDTPEHLMEQRQGREVLHLCVKGKAKEICGLLASYPLALEKCEADAEDDCVSLTVTVTEEEDIREELFYAFAEAKMPILEMSRERASLEKLFLELTQDAPEAAGESGEGSGETEEAESGEDSGTVLSKNVPKREETEASGLSDGGEITAADASDLNAEIEESPEESQKEGNDHAGNL